MLVLLYSLSSVLLGDSNEGLLHVTMPSLLRCQGAGQIEPKRSPASSPVCNLNWNLLITPGLYPLFPWGLFALLSGKAISTQWVDPAAVDLWILLLRKHPF